MKLFSPTSFAYNSITKKFIYNDRVVVAEKVIVKATLTLVLDKRKVGIGPGSYTLDELRKCLS